jgi:GT2 family glycosyltransferase
MNRAAEGRALVEGVQFPEEHPKIYDPETLETPWISGACFLIPLEIWRAIGGFDENIFLYCEDVDLSWTCRRLGYKTKICPSALFYHDTTNRGHQAWRYREMLMSARYLGHKWQSPEFVDWADNQLIELGHARAKSDLPPLGELPTVKRNGTADFQHGFHFAPVRWS